MPGVSGSKRRNKESPKRYGAALRRRLTGTLIPITIRILPSAAEIV
jgi:hypothetical protein